MHTRFSDGPSETGTRRQTSWRQLWTVTAYFAWQDSSASTQRQLERATRGQHAHERSKAAASWSTRARRRGTRRVRSRAGDPLPCSFRSLARPVRTALVTKETFSHSRSLPVGPLMHSILCMARQQRIYTAALFVSESSSPSPDCFAVPLPRHHVVPAVRRRAPGRVGPGTGLTLGRHGLTTTAGCESGLRRRERERAV
jgi:hypothetical protein